MHVTHIINTRHQKRKYNVKKKFTYKYNDSCIDLKKQQYDCFMGA